MKRLVLLFVPLIASACDDWKSSGPDRLRDAYPASCGGEDPGAPAPDGRIVVAPSERVAGTWAARVVQKGRMAIPTVCDDCLLTLTDLAVVEVPSDGGSVLWRFCDQAMDLDTTPADPADPPDPDAPHSTVPEALANAGVSAGVAFASPATVRLPSHRVVWLWGVRDLADPARDPLPESADSPSVFDQDLDGHPGVTIRVDRPLEGERYMVRRALWDLAEAAVSPDGLWVGGTLTFTVEERALGADNPLLTILAPITPEAEGNGYVMRRVPPDVTCEDLRPLAATLFAAAPSPGR